MFMNLIDLVAGSSDLKVPIYMFKLSQNPKIGTSGPKNWIDLHEIPRITEQRNN